MRKSLFIFTGLFLSLFAIGQSVVWEKYLGNSEALMGKSVITTQDRIYVASYLTQEFDNSGNPGGVDILVSGLDANGNALWTTVLGGSGDDETFSMLKAGDGNLLILGGTDSGDGVFSEGQGRSDGFVIKLDENGGVLWARQYGGAGDDIILSGTMAGNGDIYIAGFTDSDDQGLAGHGLLDAWVLKISGDGEIIWQKSYGGAYNDILTDIEIGEDSQLISCGYTRSADQDIEGFVGTPNESSDNGWIIVLNSEGDIQHQHCFGQTDSIDVAFGSIQMVGKDQILVAGELSEYDNSSSSGNYRVVLASYSGTLELLRSRIFFGTGNYTLDDLLREENGDLYLVGSWNNQGASSFEPFGQTDQYVVKVNADLEFEWEHYSGNAGTDYGLSAAVDSEGHLIVAGSRDNRAYLTRINPLFLTRNEVCLCPGDSIWINGTPISEEGIFYDTLVSVSGTDSLVQYNLMLKPSYYFESSYGNLCNMEIVLHDSIINESGDYVFAYKTNLDCDSIYKYSLDFMVIEDRVEVEDARLTAFQSGALYQWYNCMDNQAIEGAVNRTFQVVESGEYKVVISVGECSVESDCYQVYATESFNDNKENLKIYPNPAGTFLFVSNDNQKLRSVILTDMMGCVRARYSGSGPQMKLDVSEISGGLYMLQIETDSGTLIKRILIQ